MARLARTKAAALRALALGGLVAAATVFAAAPAPARIQPTITVELGKPVIKDFPKFNQQFPGKPDPQSCVAAADFCDTMPVKVPEPKGLPRGDDYWLEIVVTWLGGSANDLDMFLYDDGQTERERQAQGANEPTEPPKTSPYTSKAEATGGESGKMVFRLAEPRLVDYHLVVVNALGTSYGYHLEARIITEDFIGAIELAEEDDAGFFFEESLEDDDEAPIDTSGQEDPSGGDFGPPVDAPAPALDEVAPIADDELDGLGRRTATSVPGTETAGALPTASTERPDPPSALVVLLWFAVLPGSMLGGLAYWLMKRRRSGFSFG